MTTETVFLVGLGIWVLVLSALFFLFANFFRRLTKDAKGEDLKKILERILEKEAKNTQETAELKKALSGLTAEGFGHIQKLGLIRFNPFKEIGGDHSFSLAILDGKDNGVVITGLHTRERTRIYVKGIEKGKSELELSEEEKKALVKAQKG